MMNTYGPSDALSAFLPPEFDLPNESDEAIDFIAKRERLTATILNLKEIAQYEQVELITGQQFYDNTTPSASLPDQKRYTFRKVFDMVAANGGNIGTSTTVTLAHGIDIISTPTKMYGSFTNTSGEYGPLPYIDVASFNNSIQIKADATNVYLITGSGATTLTQAYIIFEYTKN